MNFLFPAAWGMLAIGLPVIALYLIRTQLERRRVSTLLFWDQLRTPAYQSALWRKLRRLISLLLQLLFVLLLAAALAGPLAPWQSAQPAATVFVIDPSVTMEAKEKETTRWVQAMDLLKARLGQMRAFDRAALVLAGNPPRVLSGWTSSRRILEDALKDVSPGAAPNTMQGALATARQIASTQPDARIEVVTDGVWLDAPPTLDDVRLLLVGETQPNAGIVRFSARRLPGSSDQIRIGAEVVSHFEEPIEGSIELLRNGRLIDAQALALEPQKPWKKEWDIRTDQAADLVLRLVDFPVDALSADDQAKAHIEAIAPLDVVLISEPNPFLEAALNALPRVVWKNANRADLPAQPDPNVLYVFHRIDPPASFAGAQILLLNPDQAGFWGRPDGKVDRPMVGDMNRDSALLRHTGFRNVRLDAATKWIVPPGSEILVESFGDPLIFGHWDERAHWLVVGFPLDASDLVLRTAFPIFLGNIVESLRPLRTLSEDSQPGAIKTALQRTIPGDQGMAAAVLPGWWSSIPLWWLLTAAAALWLLVEWALFTRRITE